MNFESKDVIVDLVMDMIHSGHLISSVDAQNTQRPTTVHDSKKIMFLN